MAFKGTLKEFKVPDILQLISLQGKTGILTFTSNEGFITLIFETGMIVGVDSFPKKLEMRVGNVLVKQDYISDEMLQRALTIQKRTSQKIGEILMGMGLIGKETINESLKTQAVEIVLSLFKWKKGEYNFKIIENLDPTMKIITPIPTDNLIMEGVQMLDEWPLIKKVISDDALVFEPVPLESNEIEIIEEYEDESDIKRNDKIYLSVIEANLLKYVNGVNTVSDLVELGIFTEYKVYKSLYNLVNKNIIKVKTAAEHVGDKHDVDGILDSLKVASTGNLTIFFYVMLVVMLSLLIFTFTKPLKPFHKENVIVKTKIFKGLVSDTTQKNDQGKEKTTKK